MGYKKLSDSDKEQIKADLAGSPLSQKDIAVKYGISEARVSQFKVENQQQIETIAEKALERVTGDLIQNKQWLHLQLERDLAKLEGYRSPDAVRTRTGIIKLAAELSGQMPPRMQVAIIPVQHIYEGVDVDSV